MDDELVLMHYGTKGMKWGVRKSKKETGVSRAAGAAADSFRNSADYQTRKAGRQKKLAGKLGVATEGAGGRSLAKAKKLNDRADRVEAGKATATDILASSMRVSVASLVVTNRAPEKGPKAPKAPKQKTPRKPLTKTGRLLKEEREANKKAGVKVGDAKWRQANKDRFSRK